MNTKELKTIIEQGESHILEFKASTAQLKSALETTCAFLNKDGGILLFGVTDQGKIIGQSVSDKTKQEIAFELGKIEPPAQIDVEYVSINQDKQVIILKASKGMHAPYVYNGRPFQREQSITIKMPQHKYDQLVSNRGQLNFSWEKHTAENYNVDNLDQNLILGVVRKAVEIKRMPEEALRQNIPDILYALGLLENGNIINAAVVLFGGKLNTDFIQCELKLARFKGITKDEFIDSDIIRANIFQLLEHGVSFVRKHLPVASKFEDDKLERTDIPLIPFNAIREALINALCHRDYANRGGDIGIAIFDDRMEITNSGGLIDDLTLEKIKAGISKRRNPIIADVLYRCNLIEKWGRGIQKIITLCIDAGDPEPQFDVQWNSEFKVIFKFPINIGLPKANLIESAGHLTSRQEKIIQILKETGPLSAEAILNNLDESITLRTLRRDLNSLQSNNIVEIKGKTTNAVWALRTS